MINEQEVFASVQSSKNYNMLSTDLIKRIVSEEAKKFKSTKDCIKSVKNKLHLNVDLFFNNSKINSLSHSDLNNEAVILELLKAHTSTSERLSIYQMFFCDVFKKCKNVKSILDLGCGLNPLYIPFVPELQNKKYVAVDVNNNTTSLLNKFFEVRKIDGTALTCDILSSVPSEKFDMAFLFKIVPLIEGQRKNYLSEILKSINASFIVVTFPTKTVSGRDVNMAENYRVRFLEFCKSEHIKVIFEKNYTNEAVFIIEKF